MGLIFGIVQVRVAARDRRERLILEALRNFQTREFAERIAQLDYHAGLSNYKDWQSLPSDGQEMESLGSFVTTSWQKYKAVFAEIREKQPDPFLGEYFQSLAELIEDRMNKNLRKPFYQIVQLHN